MPYYHTPENRKMQVFSEKRGKGAQDDWIYVSVLYFCSLHSVEKTLTIEEANSSEKER